MSDPEEREESEAPDAGVEQSVPAAEPSAEAEEEAPAAVEEPDPLTEAERQRDEYLELARRARADFDNYRRRVSTQAVEMERRGKATVARELLPALDNLDRALTASGVDPDERPDPGGEPPSEEVSARDALAEGIALVYRELRAGLERVGVSIYDPVGERFDPALHEAITTAQANGIEPGMVLETLERGYRIDEQVIRPARVVVSG